MEHQRIQPFQISQVFVPRFVCLHTYSKVRNIKKKKKSRNIDGVGEIGVFILRGRHLKIPTLKPWMLMARIWTLQVPVWVILLKQGWRMAKTNIGQRIKMPALCSPGSLLVCEADCQCVIAELVSIMGSRCCGYGGARSGKILCTGSGIQ